MAKDIEEVDDVIAKLSGPSLAEYLDFLETSSNAPADPAEQEQETLNTPHIDQVLSSYRERTVKSEDDSSPHVQARLLVLEQQLASLLKRSEERLTPAKNTVVQKRGGGIKSSRDSTSSDAVRRVEREQRHIASVHEDRRKRMRLVREKKNNDNPVQQLTRELDSERERRWKAEQAARKLITHIRLLQASEEEQRRNHEVALSRVMKLEQDIVTEREVALAHVEEAKQAKVAMETMKDQYSEHERRHGNDLRTIEEMQRTHRQQVMQWDNDRNILTCRAREGEARLEASEKELLLLRKTVKQLRQQLSQVQELLATRELEHRKELESSHRSREMQQVVDNEVAKEVAKERQKLAVTIDEYKNRLSEQHQVIAAMENEFRNTLANESNRYQELEKSYKSLQEELQASNDIAVMATKQEQKVTGVVADLTAMVKEQRGRIAELTKCKQECVAEYKERIVKLEGDVAIKCKLQTQLNCLQEDYAKVQSQLTAHVAMVNGLREEKRLWEQELAQQGASLAQDRGRMEAKVETIEQEINQLKVKNRQLSDNLKVKDKMCDDHNDTILQLKQTLAAQDHMIQELQDTWQKKEQEFHHQLEQEELTSQDLHEQLEALIERKEQLKLQLRQSREECEHCSDKYKQLNAEWDKRLGLMAALEDQVTQLQNNYEQKERKLVAERDEALQQARLVGEKLRASNEAFSEQLEAKRLQYHQLLEEAVRNKEQELAIANSKVSNMENEMRELLEEIAAEKKLMEDKMQKLSAVFHELQPL